MYNAVDLPFSESIAFAESLIHGQFINLDDSITLAEELSKYIEFYQTVAETVTISEDLIKDIEIPFDDSIAITESSSRRRGIILSDSLVITDECTPDIQATERIHQVAFLRNVMV